MASDQAETYLRLMAETELRHALAQPKVHEPRRPLSARLIGSRSRRARLARAIRMSWYTYRMIAGGRRHSQRGAYYGLRRLAAAAEALIAVDAVDEEVATKVMADQQIALELRQRLLHGHLHRLRMFANLPGWYGHGARAASGPPTGPFRAVGVAKRTAFELDGEPVEVTVVALVIAPDRAVLTITANRQAETDDDEMMFLDSVKAVDNNGGQYSLGFSGSGGDDEWAGELDMHPVPLPGIRWLDVTFVPGTRPVRINLDQVTLPEPAIEPLPRSGLAERYLDRVAEQLYEGEDWEARSWSDGVTALLGTGLVTLENPAISQLATFAKRLGASVPSNLAVQAETELSERWQSVLDASGANDGPTGIAPAVAVLPEFDGSRWVIAGLRSGPYAAELDVLGWGPDPDRSFQAEMNLPTHKFSWWARDNTGRWHVAGTADGSSDDMHTDCTLRFIPPLHPAATSIDIVLTGQSGRVTVTLPLDWAPVDGTQP